MQGRCETLLEDLSVKEAQWSEKEERLKMEASFFLLKIYLSLYMVFVPPHCPRSTTLTHTHTCTHMHTHTHTHTTHTHTHTHTHYTHKHTHRLPERYHEWITNAEKKMEELQQINTMLCVHCDTSSCSFSNCTTVHVYTGVCVCEGGGAM